MLQGNDGQENVQLAAELMKKGVEQTAVMRTDEPASPTACKYTLEELLQEQQVCQNHI